MTFGGAGRDWAGSVQQTADGGFVIAGWTQSFGAGRSDVWLIKTDEEGNKEWSRTFGGTERDGAGSVQQTADGGFVIAGGTQSFGAGGYDVWLIKTDEEGNKEWSRTFGGTERDWARSVQQTADGGFIIAGNTASFGAGQYDAWLIEIDEEGNKEWSRTFGGTDIEDASSVQQTTDSGFIIVGSRRAGPVPPPALESDFWVIKTDHQGNKEWSRTFDGSWTDSGAYVEQTRDGGFIIAGSIGRCALIGAGDSDVWLIKTDEEGNKEWSQTYGGRQREWAACVQQTRDGGFIIFGMTRSFGAGDTDFWLVKTDQRGNEEWNKTFGGTYRDWGGSVRQLSDGGFIIIASIGDKIGDDKDVWLIRLAPVTGQ
jgi:hypothetical protein